MTVFLTADLMFASRVEGAARDLPLAVVGSAAELIERCRQGGVKLAILDLTAPNLDVSQLVPQLKALDHGPAVVAFGPHVHEARLQAAAAAGCDQVLSRGQFNARLVDILQKGA